MNRKTVEPQTKTDRWRRFFVPEINRRTLIRWGISAGIIVIFAVLFKPCFISGSSMEPTYHDRGILLIFRWSYLFDDPGYGDVVSVNYFGRKELLKRVIAVAGDTVEFRNGVLFVNGIARQEDYVKYPCSWNVSPVTVKKGFCFVAGDNRNQHAAEHMFGEVKLSRISGGALW